MDKWTPAIVSILTGIVGVAIVAVLVSKKSATSDVLKSFFSGYATIIQAAVSPVTGGGGGSSSGGLSMPQLPTLPNFGQ